MEGMARKGSRAIGRLCAHASGADDGNRHDPRMLPMALAWAKAASRTRRWDAP